MSASSRLRVLHPDLGKALEQLAETERYYRLFRADYPGSGVAHDYDLVILADLLADYYTCIGTAFVRVTKQFENELDREKWHKSLLERMTIDVPGTRRLVRDDLLGFQGFVQELIGRTE